MNILIGPYIGSIEQEIFTFRPHTMWIYRCLLPYNYNFFIASHNKHKFLYNWPNVTYLPIDSRFSNDDDHNGIINTKVSNKDYLAMLKHLRNTINDDNVLQYYVRYTKYNNFTVPISKKLFLPLDIPANTSDNIFIINRNDNKRVIERIRKKIPEAVEIVTIDVNDTESILGMIMSAKMVICPCGEWTYFCNLHKIPVFSWGDEGIGMYKIGGPYHFNNYKSEIMFFNNGKIDTLVNGIKYLENRI
jgi:hypothetical protein